MMFYYYYFILINVESTVLERKTEHRIHFVWLSCGLFTLNKLSEICL